MVNLKKETDIPVEEPAQNTEQKIVEPAESMAEAEKSVQSTTTETSTTSEPTPKKQIKLPKNTSFQITKELKIVTGISLALIILVGVVAYQSGVNKNIATHVYSLSEKYRKMADELEDTKTELRENESLLKELENYKKNKKELTENLNTKDEELKGLISQVEQKQQELDKLTGDILAAKGEPITLPAGQFVVGNDIPAGRYRISGTSNFFVRNSNGKLKVNTILGDSWVGDGDYICNLNTGDNVENNARTTFTPIE